MPRTKVYDADQPIANREPFTTTTGSLTGIVGEVSDTGDLPADLAAQYHADHPTYTVMSYCTVIGWDGDNGPQVPQVRYSVTTSQHQMIAWRGFRIDGHYYRQPDHGRAVPPGHYGSRQGW